LAILGIAEAECERHIALDIGIAGLGRLLADALDATLIQQNYSRLVIDCNRPLGRGDLDLGHQRTYSDPR
jgi:predicted N-formylglutamate amidohydrolase